MQAVILVGGEGTRLRPLTYTRPKSMLPVLNRPFLEHMLAHLRQNGVTEVILALHYLPDAIRSYFGDGSRWGVRLHYVVEPFPLGTAGPLKFVADRLTSTFVVCNGDVFTDLDLRQVLALHRQKGALATIVLTAVDDPTPFGMVETAPDGRVLRFKEKPSRDEVTTLWVNAGTYILEPEVLRWVPPGQKYMVEHGLFPALLEAGQPVFAFRSRAYWLDMGNPRTYMRLHRDLLLGLVSSPFALDGVTERQPGVWLAPSASVDETAILKGPLVLGEGCTIGPGAKVVGPAVLGPRCHLHEGSHIVEALLWEQVVLHPHARAEGCILGAGVCLQARASVGRGCVLADGVVVGEGNRLERGITLAPGTHLPPRSIGMLDSY
ncbi:MAG: NDP-sugar synthase [Dehalococcoidia bacterium]|nr:NDP-sugar synthase [Dehalococcoidia bacterium]MDW8119606.1 NDP-sugar synthase [Chloroflexota bacterium]